MLVIHNGHEYNVTNKFTLGQLLKNGAVLVENKADTVTEETVKAEPKRKSNSKK